MAKAIYIGICVWLSLACLLMTVIAYYTNPRFVYIWLAGVYLFGYLAFYLRTI